MKMLLPLAILALGGCSVLEGGSANYGEDEAVAGAAFRSEAFEAFAKLQPVCPFTDNADQLARYEEPRARYQAVKDWVADTPFAIDLVISEANFRHYWSVNQAECGTTDTEDSMARFDAELGALNQRLSNLEKLAGVI